MTIKEVVATTIKPPAPEQFSCCTWSERSTVARKRPLGTPCEPGLGRPPSSGCSSAASSTPSPHGQPPLVGSREPFVAPMRFKTEAQAEDSWTLEELRSHALAALHAYLSANRSCSGKSLSEPTLFNIGEGPASRKHCRHLRGQ